MMPLEAVGEMCSYISLVAQEKVEKMNFWIKLFRCGVEILVSNLLNFFFFSIDALKKK